MFWDGMSLTRQESCKSYTGTQHSIGGMGYGIEALAFAPFAHTEMTVKQMRE